jgi:hypothetical protein
VSTTTKCRCDGGDPGLSCRGGRYQTKFGSIHQARAAKDRHAPVLYVLCVEDLADLLGPRHRIPARHSVELHQCSHSHEAREVLHRGEQRAKGIDRSLVL